MLKLVTIILILVSLAFADDCVTITPRSTQCTTQTVKDCSRGFGSVTWPYPESTCKFHIHFNGGDKKNANIMVVNRPDAWKIEDFQGRVFFEGRGIF